MDGRLLDLDDLAPGRDQLPELALSTVAMSHMSSRLSSSYTSVLTVRTVEARSAAIVPNLTGFSVRDCATRHTLANSSGTRGPTLSTMAWYFQPPTISLSQVPTGYVQPAVVSVSYSEMPLRRSLG